MKNANPGRRCGLLAALLTVAGLVAGCRTIDSGGSAQNTYSGEYGDGEVTESLGDSRLARQLVMESIRTDRRDGRLYVQFDLRNAQSSNRAFEWTIVWLDGNGMVLDTPRTWTPAKLGGNDVLTISRTAPDGTATGFRLGVRRPNTIR